MTLPLVTNMARKNTTKSQAAIKATISGILSEGRLVLTDNDLETLRKNMGRTLTKDNVMDFIVDARAAGIDSPTEFTDMDALGLPEGRREKGTLPQFPEKGEDGKFRFPKPDSSAGMREAVSRATPSVAEKDLRNVNSVFSGLPVRTAIANSPVAPLNITEEGARLVIELMKEESKNNTVNLSPANPSVLEKAGFTLDEIDVLKKVPSFSSPVVGPLIKIKLLHDALVAVESDVRSVGRAGYEASSQVNAYKAYMEESPSKFLPRLPNSAEVQRAFKSKKLSPDQYYTFITQLRTGLEQMFPQMLTASQSIEDNARVLSHALHQSGFLIDADPNLLETKREYIRNNGTFNPTGDQLIPGEEGSQSRGTMLGAKFMGTELEKFPGEGLVQGDQPTLSQINNGGLSVPVGRDERTGKVVFEPSGVAPFKYTLNEEKAGKLNVDTREIFKNANTAAAISVVNDITPISAPDKLIPPPTKEVVKTEEKPKLPPKVKAREKTKEAQEELKKLRKEYFEQPEDGRKKRKTPRGAFSKRTLRTVGPAAGGFLGGLFSVIDYVLSSTPTARSTPAEVRYDEIVRKSLEDAEREELIPEETEVMGRAIEEVKSRTSFMNQ